MQTLYIELHAHSAFSFLDGASAPTELAAIAAQLGYPAFALTDHDGVWGSMEFAHACAGIGVRPITGAEVSIAGGDGHADGTPGHLTLLAEPRPATRTSVGSSPPPMPTPARAPSAPRPSPG